MLLASLCIEVGGAADRVLPSWNEGAARTAIIDFVTEVSDRSNSHYVPPAERIASFDNDGTLWCEKPPYGQVFFMWARVLKIAPKHPEWKKTYPFKVVLEKDMKWLGSASQNDIMTLLMATHSGMTADRFKHEVTVFLEKAKHPRFGVPFTKLTYQPMLELLAYMRQHGFKTFICTGGGMEFVRVFSQDGYGIPPDQVIGSTLKYKLQDDLASGSIMRLPTIDLITDGPGKPVGIQLHIGQRPIFAIGNSDGDFQMLEFSGKPPGPGLKMLVHHEDAVREYAYNKGAEKTLAACKQRGWIVVSMKNDWNRISSSTNRRHVGGAPADY